MLLDSHHFFTSPELTSASKPTRVSCPQFNHNARSSSTIGSYSKIFSCQEGFEGSVVLGADVMALVIYSKDPGCSSATLPTKERSAPSFIDKDRSMSGVGEKLGSGDDCGVADDAILSSDSESGISTTIRDIFALRCGVAGAGRVSA